MSRILVLGLVALICTACTSATQSASVTEPTSGATVIIELEPAHPYLAEYNRTLIVRKDGLREGRYELSRDTGGYAAANLYACSENFLMLDSYSEFVVVDTSTGQISAGKCPGTLTYVGVFDGGGSKPWQFFPAAQRPEVALVSRGG